MLCTARGADAVNVGVGVVDNRIRDAAGGAVDGGVGCGDGDVVQFTQKGRVHCAKRIDVRGDHVMGDVQISTLDLKLQRTCCASAGGAEGQVFSHALNIDDGRFSKRSERFGVCLARRVALHDGGLLSVQRMIHMVSCVSADDGIAKLAVMALVVGAIERLHACGQNAVFDGRRVSVGIVVAFRLPVLLH